MGVHLIVCGRQDLSHLRYGRLDSPPPLLLGLLSTRGMDSCGNIAYSVACNRTTGEHTRYMQADHRHICKFQSPEDPNYIVLQQAFLSSIEDIESNSELLVLISDCKSPWGHN